MFGSVLWLCNTSLQFLDTVGASGHHGETKQEQEKRCEMIIKDRSDAQWPKSSLCLPASAAVIGAPPHLSLLQPIRPGEELLVWYTVEDNPEITAALEEERANSLNRKNSHRAKQGEASLQTISARALRLQLRLSRRLLAAPTPLFSPHSSRKLKWGASWLQLKEG